MYTPQVPSLEVRATLSNTQKLPKTVPRVSALLYFAGSKAGNQLPTGTPWRRVLVLWVAGYEVL